MGKNNKTVLNINSSSSSSSILPSLPVLPSFSSLALVPPPRRRGKYNSRTDNYIREKIIHWHINNNYNAKQIKNLLSDKVKLKTIYSITLQYDKTKQIQQKQTKGKQNKFNTDQRQLIINTISTNADITLKELKKELNDKHQLNMSISTISRILKSADITMKEIIRIPPERNTKSNIRLRKNYSDKMITMKEEDLIFIDETPFHLHMHRSKGHSLKGTRACITRPLNRGRNLTVIAAFSPVQGLIYYEKHYGSIDSKVYAQFFKNLLRENFIQLHSYIFIQDNSPIHTLKTLEPCLEGQRYKHEIINLPPYSPQLNPIEILFSAWKSAVKREQRVQQLTVEGINLERCIDIGAEQMKDKEKAKGYYHHVIRFYLHCIKGFALDESYNPNSINSDNNS